MPLNNENNNDCCKCTTPQYELTLNQQGPQGKTGPQGLPGFSPTIVVNTNTDRVYSLTINTIDGQIVTPNLKASVPGDGPTGYVLTKNTSTPYDMAFQPIPQATESQLGILQLATITDTQPDEEGEVDDTKAVTPNVLVEYVEQEIDNLNISNYVTLNTEQTITANKDFQGVTEFRGTRFGSQSNLLMPNQNQYNGGFQMWDLANEGSFNPQLINANPENDNGSYPGFGFLGNNPENTSITDNKYKNAIGVDLYGQSSHPIISIKNGVLGDIIDSNDIATTTKTGIVKPDGTTITIDADGTIHSVDEGTEDYTELTNKPQINGVELTGNKTGTDLGLASSNEVNQLSSTVTGLQSSKQDTLIAGEGITIQDNVISATGGQLPDNVLTSDNISQDAYIQSLEARIAALEALIDGGNSSGTSLNLSPTPAPQVNDAIPEAGYVATDEITIQDGEV